MQYVLEGSVRRESERVRITAQLIQVKDQTHVWAREYDREFRDLLPLEGEVAREIAKEIQLTFDGQKDDGRKEAASQPAAPSQRFEGYDLYLKGLYFFNKRTPTDLRQAIQYFQQATVEDPSYARGYAGLAKDTPSSLPTAISRNRNSCRRRAPLRPRHWQSIPVRRKRTPRWP